MARGDSGRIVIEVEPETKRQLYAALDLTGSTLKEWFVKRAADFSAEATQPFLFKLTNHSPKNARDQQMGTPNTGTAKFDARKSRKHRKSARSHLATQKS